MTLFKGVFYQLISTLQYYSSNYEKSLFYAKKSAKSFVKSKMIFNSKQLELTIAKCTSKVTGENVGKYGLTDNNRVGILASTLFDAGGHTECLMRFVESFHLEYELHLFLTSSSGDSNREAKTKHAYLETILPITETASGNNDFIFKISYLLDSILKSGIKMVFVYMHMDDVISCAVLSYLAKHTDVKIIFFNHGDHTFSLGFEFSDLIIELRKQGQFITQHYRKKLNTTIIPLQGVSKNKYRTYSTDVLLAKRREIGLSGDDLVSLSGFSSYKVFKDKKSRYLNYIKRLLTNEHKLKHVIMTEISSKERKIVDKVFKGSEHLLERLLIIDRVVEFDLFLQIGDVFIDSFPLGSALAHIDAIRNNRPTIIKKNYKNELFTFYTYLYDDYEYAIDDIDELVTKSLYLIRNKQEQQRVAAKGRAHYLATYEFQTIKSKYKQLIENHQYLNQFYTPLPTGYRIKINAFFV